MNNNIDRVITDCYGGKQKLGFYFTWDFRWYISKCNKFFNVNGIKVEYPNGKLPSDQTQFQYCIN